MDNFIEQQGFYDYINHFISGVVLLVGVDVIFYPDVKIISVLYNAIYNALKNIDSVLSNICIVIFFSLIFFFTGILIQELYSVLYENDNFQSKKYNSVYSRNIIFRLVHKVNKERYTKNIFRDDSIIRNKYKKQTYEKCVREIVCNEGLIISEKENIYLQSDISSYFFRYCVYYIQVRGLSKKLKS